MASSIFGENCYCVTFIIVTDKGEGVGWDRTDCQRRSHSAEADTKESIHPAYRPRANHTSGMLFGKYTTASFLIPVAD